MDVSKFKWDPLKNERLKRARGISFEEILKAKLISIERHPSKPLQDRMLYEWRDYIWVVPFIRTEDEIFLKTIYPSRKHTQRYKKAEGK